MLASGSEIQYFVEVAHTLNLSRAAERLGVSQPTLSQAIKRLEESLKVTLFVRSRAGVQLTRIGQRLLPKARKLLFEWQQLQDQAQREEHEIKGRYTLGCHTSVALYALPLLLPGLLLSHPHLELSLIHDLSRKIAEEIISFKIDFGLVVNPVEHPDLIIKLLCKDTVRLYSSEKLTHPSARDILICDPSLVQTQTLLKNLKRSGFAFKRVTTSSSLEVIASMIASGAGIGILPGRVAERDPHQKLVRVSKSPVFYDKHCLIYRADLHKSSASKYLARWIEKRITESEHLKTYPCGEPPRSNSLSKQASLLSKKNQIEIPTP